MIKMLAFDLDGTTLVNHAELSDDNRAALVKAYESGVLPVPATGRMLGFVPEIIKQLPGVRYVITSNGAAVYDLRDNSTVYQGLIENATAVKVQKILEDYDIYIEYYSNGGAITKRGYPEQAERFGLPPIKKLFIDTSPYTLVDDLGEMLKATALCPEKINLPYVPKNIYGEVWQRIEAVGGLLLTSSIGENIEINSLSANKGAAVLALGEHLSFGRDEIMCIGDNGNDVAMLKAVECSVAVEDGEASAIAAAKYITAPHDQDGLARAIEKHIFLL